MVAVQHHQREDALAFECCKCNLRFITESDLQMHSSVHNPDVIHFKCDFCKKYFGDKSSLDKHTTVHNKQSLIFTCTICSKQFNRSNNYHRHMATLHSGAFECRFCVRKFDSANSRLSHEKIVHHKIRPFRCTWKDCRFASSSWSNVFSHVGSVHFGMTRKEQRMIENTEVDFGKYVRNEHASVPARRTGQD